ncbi:CU044_5270 family protein [Streptomyces sp. WMMC897]|uniref:CU044_5270 family protein n=1 Tax=Streptomyces sp. WMMC897 TaxID=3014782 RepID=UPI0022B65254|nr:CU044_5270 family protein [Streptomyces sp. WMMC897]MCZ7417024.1 CU044_5270 family protein [Streptomyces sp. WMMC897]
MSDHPAGRANASELPERDLPPGRHALLREQLMTELRRQEHEEPGERKHTGRRTPGWVRRRGTGDGRSPRPRLLRPALGVAAVAAATAAVLTLTPALGGVQESQMIDQRAVALLEDVALAAESRKAPAEIRDDQYVYVLSKGAYRTYFQEGKTRIDPPQKRELWTAVDGSREGLLVDEGHFGGRTATEPDTPGLPTNTSYRSLQRLPTDPQEMRDWLYEHASDNEFDDDHNAFVLVGDMVRETLLPPGVAAALFRAAGTIPGVEVRDHVRDAAGREGIAVTRESRGERTEIVFDRTTKEYLGERTVRTEKDEHNGLSRGDLIGQSAVLERAVVDRTGERP